MYGDPNKERTRLLRDGPRYHDTAGTGNAAQDGYTRIARRPRVSYGYEEIMPNERADNIERIEREFTSSADLMDSY